MTTTFEQYWAAKGHLWIEMGIERAVVKEIWMDGNLANKMKLLTEICCS